MLWHHRAKRYPYLLVSVRSQRRTVLSTGAKEQQPREYVRRPLLDEGEPGAGKGAPVNVFCLPLGGYTEFSGFAGFSQTSP